MKIRMETNHILANIIYSIIVIYDSMIYKEIKRIAKIPDSKRHFKSSYRGI